MSQIIALAGILLGAGFAATGVVSGLEQLGNVTPWPLTFAQFQLQKPDKGNFRLSGATLCVPEALWIENKLSGDMGNIYVPARASATAMSDSSAEKPVLLLVKVDDPKISAMVAQVKKLDNAKTPKEQRDAAQWTLDNSAKLFVSRPIEGVLAEGFEALDSDEQRLIESSGTKLEKGFVILQENTKPQYGATIFMILAGLGLTGWGVLRLKGKAQNI